MESGTLQVDNKERTINSQGHRIGSETLVSKSPLLLNRFNVLKTLGEGAVGAVYLVNDRKQEMQEVALKVLTNTIDLDDHTHDRFKQEIAILQEIDHPNIVRAFDFIESKDTIAYTMEFIDGADLGSIFKKETFTYETINKMFLQLLSALQELHIKGVWHRDLKLENIMITKNGDIKLTDLGLVKNVFRKGYTKTGVLLGTAQYMPPEYVKTAKFDARGDLYAVGVILFEVLKRRRRMANLPGNKIIEILMEQGFQIPDKELQGMSPKYAQIIRKATDPDPKKRFQSAGEMADMFKNNENPLVDSPNVQVTQTLGFGCLKVYKKEGFFKRHLKLMFAIILVALILAFMGVAKSDVIKIGFANKKTISFLDRLPLGKYQGKINILNEGFFSNLYIKKEDKFLKVETGYNECQEGIFDFDSGFLLCGQNKMKLNIISITGNKIYGELKNIDSNKTHSFTADKV